MKKILKFILPIVAFTIFSINTFGQVTPVVTVPGDLKVTGSITLGGEEVSTWSEAAEATVDSVQHAASADTAEYARNAQTTTIDTTNIYAEIDTAQSTANTAKTTADSASMALQAGTNASGVIIFVSDSGTTYLTPTQTATLITSMAGSYDSTYIYAYFNAKVGLLEDTAIHHRNQIAELYELVYAAFDSAGATPPNIDATPPTFVSAYVANAVPNMCIVLMDTNDIQQDSVPDDEDFLLTEDDVEIDITTVDIIQDTIKLTLASSVTAETTLLLDYTSAVPALQDSTGNETDNWINYSVTNNVSLLGDFDPEYDTIYNAMTLKPEATYATYQNELVDSLVGSGYWPRILRMYVPAQQYNTNGEAYINWITPGTDDLTALGTPTWTSNVGSSTDGAGDGLNTGFNPSSDGGSVMTQYTGTIIVYLLNDLSNGNYYDVGCSNGTAQFSLASGYGGSSYVRINAGTASSFTQSNSAGFFCGTRTSESRQELYRGNTSLVETTSGTASLPNLDVYLLGRNVNGTQSDISPNTIAVAILMDGVTDEEEAEIFGFVETYCDHLGIGVH